MVGQVCRPVPAGHQGIDVEAGALPTVMRAWWVMRATWWVTSVPVSWSRLAEWIARNSRRRRSMSPDGTSSAIGLGGAQQALVVQREGTVSRASPWPTGELSVPFAHRLLVGVVVCLSPAADPTGQRVQGVVGGQRRLQGQEGVGVEERHAD